MYIFKKSVAFGLLLTGASVAFASEGFFRDFNPDTLNVYVGADLQNRHMPYKSGEGSQFFKKDSLQGNLFLGLRLHENFGVELGYEQTQRKKREVTLLPGDQTLGGVVGISQGFQTRAKLAGFHLDLMGFLPLEGYCKDLSLFAGIGVARLKAKLERTNVAVGGVQFPPVTQSFDEKNSKYVARLTAGAQYLLTENLGVRGILNYENTSRIQPQSTSPDGTRVVKVKLKDSFSYGLGVFFKFW